MTIDLPTVKCNFCGEVVSGLRRGGPCPQAWFENTRKDINTITAKIAPVRLVNVYSLPSNFTSLTLLPLINSTVWVDSLGLSTFFSTGGGGSSWGVTFLTSTSLLTGGLVSLGGLGE